MRNHRLRLLIIVLISAIAAHGCTVFQTPRSIFDVPFRERSQSKIEDDVKVTVAVLSAEESRQLFGVNLTGDPYFTAGYRVVILFDRRPHSFEDIKAFNWDKGPVSSKIKRLDTDRPQEFDEQ